MKLYLLFVLLLSMAQSAWAALGGDAASIEADRVYLNASSHVLLAKNFTVQEILTPEGTVVREYLSPAGKVFAVAWNGTFMPDLQQIFGNYYATYVNAASSRHAGRRPLVENGNELVVHSGGHMRSFVGRAYVPSLLPPNLSIDQIR